MCKVLYSIPAMLLIIAISTCIAGCSNAGPIDPAMKDIGKRTSVSSHQLWGIYQFVCDPEAGAIDITPVRAADMHLNAIVFLEPPPMVLLSLDYLEFNGNLITADIGLRHPFLGLDEFTGFDVCGILISNGSVTGFDDANLRMAGDGDTRLLNPDGYSRWWNPAEFPQDGTMFGYTDGLLGAPDSLADYNCTLNGFKYYCNGLGTTENHLSIDLDGRGVFAAGSKNVRRFEIELGTEGMVFNYAVDACWTFPNGDPPWTVPEDFPPDANRQEAWGINITETENTLWNDGSENGGELILQIDVYDWFNVDTHTVRVESPGNFDMTESSIPIGGGDGYSTYEVEILDATPAEGSIDLLVSIASDEEDFQGFIPGVNTTSYFTGTAAVTAETPVKYKNIDVTNPGGAARDLCIDPATGDVLILYDQPEVAGRYRGEVRRYSYADEYLNYTTIPDAVKHHWFDCDRGVFIDYAENGYWFIASQYGTSCPAREVGYDHYNSSDIFLVHAGIGIGSNPPGDSVTLVDAVSVFSGPYTNDHAAIYGRMDGQYWPPPNEYFQTTVRWRPDPLFSSWGGAARNWWLLPDSTGYDALNFYNIVGAETDPMGNYIWFVEDEDHYAARFNMNPGSFSMTYSGRHFGTGGAGSDNDDGVYDPLDMTCSESDHFFILDNLSDSSFAVKGFISDGSSGDGTTPLTSFDQNPTWIHDPIRMDGSPQQSMLAVLMCDGVNSALSVFLSDEIPDS